jgi:hypothetical protein
LPLENKRPRREREQISYAIDRTGTVRRAITIQGITFVCPRDLAEVLLGVARNHNHVFIDFGNQETGEREPITWFSTPAYLFASDGIMIAKVAPGDTGGLILDTQRIVRVLDVDSKKVLWEHPTFHYYQRGNA